MAISVMDNAGQVKIPETVRERLHLHAGDKVDFVVSGEGQVFLRPITHTIDDVAGMLHRPGQQPATVEEMDHAVADMLRREFR